MTTNAILPTVIQSFFIREKRALLVSYVGSVTPSPDNLVAAVVASMGQFGFTVDARLYAALKALGIVALTDFHKSTTAVLREVVGAGVNYTPLFRSFPDFVPDIGTYSLKRYLGYIESAVGPLTSSSYTLLSCGHLVNHSLFNLKDYGACPICECHADGVGDTPRLERSFTELTPLRVLGLADLDSIYATAANLAGARTSLSESQKGLLSAAISLDAARVKAALPAFIPFKENATFTVAALLEANVVTSVELSPYVTSSTDVLRLAVALCKGDVSLAEVTRFKLKNGYRQTLMQLLEMVAQPEDAMLEEMLKYRGRWLRLGEVLHARKYADRYPSVARLFDVLRNKEETITTHASRVEVLLTSGATMTAGARKELLASVAQRPGDMARRLDALLQRPIPDVDTLSVFNSVVGSVSTTILLTMLAHFRNRANPAEFRAFMPKGSVSKMHVLPGDARKPLPLATRLLVIELVTNELLNRFGRLPALGKVFVAPALEEMLVPFSQRSASSGMSPLTRGSRITLDPAKGFVRLFTHWSQSPEMDNVDVDLSVGLYGDDWHSKGQLSWTCLHGYGRTVHSGDIRSGSGPNGGCEFIDLDLEAFKKKGIRYVTVLLNSYTGQSFDEFPCFAGFMERAEPSDGGHFEPKSVTYKFDASAPVTAVIPMLVDVELGQVIWADLAVTADKVSYGTIGNMGTTMVQKLRAVQAMREQRVSVKELLELHVQARGTAAPDAQSADLVLDETLAMDEIVSAWL